MLLDLSSNNPSWWRPIFQGGNHKFFALIQQFQTILAPKTKFNPAEANLKWIVGINWLLIWARYPRLSSRTINSNSDLFYFALGDTQIECPNQNEWVPFCKKCWSSNKTRSFKKQERDARQSKMQKRFQSFVHLRHISRFSPPPPQRDHYYNRFNTFEYKIHTDLTALSIF